jgi:hypothetical protein
MQLSTVESTVADSISPPAVQRKTEAVAAAAELSILANVIIAYYTCFPDEAMP